MLKSTRYNTVEPAAIDRRDTGRQEVRIMTAARLKQHDRLLIGALHDISSYGCRVMSNGQFRKGQKIEIIFGAVSPVSGIIVWHKDGSIGCRFDNRLHPEILRNLTLALNV